MSPTASKIMELEKTISDLLNQIAKKEVAYSDERAGRIAMKDREAETRKQFDDLKQRLHGAELENQRLRGYVQRVQEDDVVREDLVQIGDPDGAVKLVPKRKSTVFSLPQEHTNFDEGVYRGLSGLSHDRPKLKHWITY